MRMLPLFASLLLAAPASAAAASAPAPAPRNVVLFVADGLRARAVDGSTAPTMARLARDGVSLRNSHALFPTFTTANASALATGHVLTEVLRDGTLPQASACVLTSEPAADGLVTILDVQRVGTTRYFDAAGFPGRTVELSDAPLPCPQR